MADAGDIWFRALSGIGQNIGGGIAAIGEDYQQRHKAYQQQAGIADALSKIGVTPDGQLAPVGTELIGQDGKSVKVKSLIDQNAYDNFMARNKANSAEAIGGLNALNRLYSSALTHAMTPTYSVPVPGVGKVQLTGPQAATYSAASQRANRVATGKTTNPDLNFTHAVKAHGAQVKQIEDYFVNNYGVHPIDVLNSDRQEGLVWDKDKKGYVNATGDRVQNPDLIKIAIGDKKLDPKGNPYQDYSYLPGDVAQRLRPQAETYKKLQESPPKREDYMQQQSGFVPDARALQIRAAYKAGKISPEEAIKALQAQ